MLLLAGYTALLHRLTLQEDILVGGAEGGRNGPELAAAVGMFVNTVVFRNRPTGKMPFRALLQAVKHNCLAVYDHQVFPFESMATLNRSRPNGRNALFDTMLSYENAGERTFRIKNLDFTIRDFPLRTAMFDVHLDVIEDQSALNLKFGYATALFRHETVVRWAGYFEAIVNAVLTDPDCPVGAIDLVGNAEAAAIEAINATDARYPHDKTIVDLFQEQVDAGADRPAVLCDGAALTYGELNIHADRVAQVLRAAHEITPDTTVGIYLDRSVWVAVAMLGILKAGAAYVPVDLDHPADLVRHIFADSACAAVLTTRDLAQRLPDDVAALAVDIAASPPRARPGLPFAAAGPDDVAYVIYTSGSTGRPKGCAVTHRNVVRLMKNDQHPFDFGPQDVWICAHSFCFDFSVWELYGALLYGGRVAIASKHETRDPRLLLSLIREHRVTVLNQTPAAFYALVDAEVTHPVHSLAAHLRLAIFGGDRLEPTFLAPWADIYPLDRIALVNMYGITETTVHVTFYRLGAADVYGPAGRSLIGRPLPETRVYVCDDDRKRQPIGVPGELYIGGTGVCKGYLNRPELATQRFVDSWFRAGEKLYRTGDVGRILVDGTLEYLGRNDSQVQLRGHRVELGAVTHALLGHPDVRKAIVVDRDSTNGKELVAYVIGEAGLTGAALRQHLALTLPVYMIPAHFVRLEELPLTANGKLDRAALPPPDANRLDTGTAYAAPRNAVEEMIADVWQRVLGVSRVGIHDNYFALGGDSIKALQIANQLHRAGLRVSLGQIFVARTIAELAALRGGAAPAPAAAPQSAPLSAIQSWFVAEHASGLNHFNNAVVLRAAGAVDERALQQAVDALHRHHEALRLRLIRDAGMPRQEVLSGPAPMVAAHDLRRSRNAADALARHAETLQCSFDLEMGGLFRTALFRLPDGDRVLLVCHHWMVDGVSWRILLEDLSSAYTQARTVSEIELPPPSDSYLRWALAQQSYATSAPLLEEAAFWAEMDDAGSVPPLPRDFDDPRNLYGDVAVVSFELSAEETAVLLGPARGASAPRPNELMLAAVAQAVRVQFGSTRIRVQVEGHGREDITPGLDVHRTVGWFTSIYPVVLDIGDARDASAQLQRVQEQVGRIPRNGVGYAILRYLTPSAARGAIASGPAPEIGFNYLGQFDDHAEEAPFTLASESVGAVQGKRLARHQLIDVEAMTVGKCLKVSITYSRRQHRHETIAALAGHLQDALRRNLATCRDARLPARDWGLPTIDVDHVIGQLGVARQEVETVLPLSSLQEGMLFHALAGDRQSYFEQFTFRVSGTPDVPRFAAAWRELARSHQVLRVAFVQTASQQPLQVVLRNRTVEVECRDLRGLPHGGRSRAINKVRCDDLDRWWDLARDPLMRVTLLHTHDDELVVIWSCHHIIIDGWSAAILLQDLMAAYAALAARRMPALPPAPDYALYLEWLGRRDHQASRAYWTKYLSDCPAATPVPDVELDRHHAGYVLGEHVFVFDAETSAALSQLAVRLQVTLNVLLQTLWAVLLARYNGTDDVLFGAVVSGRPPDLAGIERTVGLFLQSIPVRIRVAPTKPLSTLAQEVQAEAAASEPHHHFPLPELQMLSGVRRTLFNHLVVFENYPIGSELASSGLCIDDVHVYEQMHYDFSLVIHPAARIEVKFTCNRNVVFAPQLERLEAHLRTLVASVLRAPDSAAADLDIVPADEQQELARATCTEARDEAAACTVLDLFEAQVRRTPGGVAIEAADSVLSYSALDTRANALARVLRTEGAARNERIALFLPHGADYVAGIIAVQKACAVFVPLDVHQPPRRLQVFMEKLRPRLILTDETFRSALSSALNGMRFSGSPPVVLSFAGPGGVLKAEHPGAPVLPVQDNGADMLPERPAPADSMYVMCTSGSTGEPKAIVSSHEALHHFITWEQRYLGIDESVRASALALPTFDVSLRDIFLPIVTGGTLCVPPGEIRTDFHRLGGWLRESRITLIHVVPTVFRALLNEIAASPAPGLPDLHRILFAGEPLPGKLVNEVRRWLGTGVAMFNLYGPSETTLAKCCFPIGDGEVDPTGALPIGRPIDGTRVFILKKDRSAASGEIGEICIAPPFRCKGYLDDPALTAERFIRHRLAPDTVLYRTGDLGRLLRDGNIQFCGRVDRQVKVNGVRVELAEIERAFLSAPEIDQTVVSAHRNADGDNVLVCYYTERVPVAVSELRACAAERLPRALVPAHFLRLDAFPVNINGKIDVRALPKPEELIAHRVPFDPPADDLERRIAAIWCDVLGVKSVGVNSPFFAIGGDSLRTIRVIGRINREFESALSIAAFFQAPTVRATAASLRSGREKLGDAIPALPPARDYVVSHAQRRLWVLDQLVPENPAYNLPAAYLLEGSLDVTRMQRAFAALVARHEVLRTTFAAVDGEPRQQIHDDVGTALEIVDLRGELDPRVAALALARENAEHRFDLARGPLFRARLLLLGTERYVLLVNIHHIVSDAHSISMMVEEILALYRTDAKRLAPSRVQYKDFAAWENTRVTSGEAARHRAYWHAQLSRPLEPLELPLDRPRPATPRLRGDRVSRALGDATVRELRAFCEARHGTAFMGLVAAVKALLFRHTGQEDIVVGTPVTTRDDEELQRQLGFFVNTLPLRDRVSAHEGFDGLFTHVRTTTLAALEHRLYPFSRLVDELELARDISRPPIFEVMVVLQDRSQRTFAVDGVRVSEFFSDWKVSKYSLTFEFVETGTDGLSLYLEYDSDLFDRDRIERMAEQFAQLLANALAEPGEPLHRLNLLPEAERNVVSGCNPVVAIPADQTIVGLFEEMARAFPDNLAVISDDAELSYAEFNAMANRVAERLAKAGVGRGSWVAVLIDRSERWVAAFLGILKAGGVYLPLDASYPRERLDYMLMDSGCSTIVTEARHRALIDGGDRTVIEIETVPASDAPDPAPAAGPSDLAYVIYTSGSTGKPKGVLLEHAGAVNLAFAQRLGLGIRPTDRVLQFAPSSFDASVWEVLMALMNGACLVIAADHHIGDPREFAWLLADRRVSVATLPPSYVAQLAPEDVATLQLLVTAGEQPRVDQALMLSRRIRYVNAYGPTETTVCATWHMVDPARTYDGVIPIGRAIANNEVVVLDPHGNLAPIGVVGEICIGGRGLARGYHRRPDLTEASFVSHPHRPGARLYRTGDLGNVRADGEIVYRGRNDRQVKVRGHRIELGEIERCLLQHATVRQAVVALHAKPHGDADLVAYVVAAAALQTGALRDHLTRELPPYMIPAHWVRLDAMPLMPNGKVDHAALPPPGDGAATRARYQPENELEIRIAEVWRSVLRRDDFCAQDHFFEVGGDSIKAIQIVNLLRRAGFKLHVRDFLQWPTISGLVSRLGDQTPTNGAHGAHVAQTQPTPGRLTTVPLSTYEFTELFGRE
jgi:amino acid adenylation domain-containing protein/non-ribosomal peptide synthase protein (TIGR01720 family)